MSIRTPWIIQPDDLEQLLQKKEVVVVDISNKNSYAQHHIPGARFIDYTSIVKHNPPVFGMLPDNKQFSRTLSVAGISPDDYIVAYDEEGGGKAGRLLWTLEIAGHQKMSLLDGGIVNWMLQKNAVDQSTEASTITDYPVEFHFTRGIADADYIFTHLNEPWLQVLDTRSANEFNGTVIRSARAGHIPGASNIDWLMFKNPESQKLLDSSSLQNLLDKHAVNRDKEIIVHCHSHHRSALCYVALKHLGYKNVRGYPGSWSDWATRMEMPVETQSLMTE